MTKGIEIWRQICMPSAIQVREAEEDDGVCDGRPQTGMLKTIIVDLYTF